MNLRLSVIIASFIATLLVLFAAWQIYWAWFVEKPIEQRLAAIEGVQDASIERSRQDWRVVLALADEAELKTVHEAALDAVKPLAKGREVDIHFEAQPSREMEDAWHELQFHVEEALSLHQYRRLPEIAATMKEQLQLEKALVDINTEYVYFQFQKGENRLYLIYPRQRGEEGSRG